ncbi:hypothetical protein I4F81_012427 [Pyropia yezoensis]|uniref:Uncharacterized protein n=1 Tax=Pyropia yezoensis TaxID=2788 RepID=A0ACC3CIG7_PYRYE|nr:hypothetical protein I4F81_012427 [Neopyropia yezoensis]
MALPLLSRTLRPPLRSTGRPAGAGAAASTAAVAATTAAAAAAAASTAAAGGVRGLRTRAFQIWGATTAVGKTLVAGGLARAIPAAAPAGAGDAASSAAAAAAPAAAPAPVAGKAVAPKASAPAPTRVAYLKPVQTGPPADHDGAAVRRAVDGTPGGAHVTTTTLHSFAAAASPHSAAAAAAAAAAAGSGGGGGVVAAADASDGAVLAGVRAHLQAAAAAGEVALVETAGGPLSPLPSGTAAADAYRPLRLPGVLVGEPRLGGISVTLAAAEALASRGHDLPAVVLLPGLVPRDEWEWGLLGEAVAAVQAGLAHRGLGGGGGALGHPAGPAGWAPRVVAIGDPGGVPRVGDLTSWYASVDAAFAGLWRHLVAWEAERERTLAAMAADAGRVLWFPFAQHGPRGGAGVVPTVVDSAWGDDLTVYEAAGGVGGVGAAPPAGAPGGASPPSPTGVRDTAAAAGPGGSPAPPGELTPITDGFGSWWTVGVGHGSPRAAAVTAATVGRYGHVPVAGLVHAPAVRLAHTLLGGVGAGWAERVFYSDNGSTATAWYVARGVHLDPPVLACRGGTWTVATPPWYAAPRGGGSRGDGTDGGLTFPSRDAAFAPARAASPVAAAYAAHIDAVLDAAAAGDPARGTPPPILGALLMEPLLQGAGGMRLLDPLFVTTLAASAAGRGIPLVVDEVFTGLGRLGAPSGAALAGLTPAVGAYAKLLTGGSAPLAVTLASGAVFDAFRGGALTDALLHGHSYSGHPTGCAVAADALATYPPHLVGGPPPPPPPPADGGSSNGSGNDGGAAAGGLPPPPPAGVPGAASAWWDEAAVAALSAVPGVASSTVVGTVVSVEMEGAAGYGGGGGAARAAAVVRRLRAAGVLCRPLGGVVYLLVSPVTPRAAVVPLLEKLDAAVRDVCREGA